MLIEIMYSFLKKTQNFYIQIDFSKLYKSFVKLHKLYVGITVITSPVPFIKNV